MVWEDGEEPKRTVGLTSYREGSFPRSPSPPPPCPPPLPQVTAAC